MRYKTKACTESEADPRFRQHDTGVKHFCIGWDVRVLYDWWQLNGAGMREMLTSTATSAAAQRPKVSAY